MIFMTLLHRTTTLRHGSRALENISTQYCYYERRLIIFFLLFWISNVMIWQKCPVLHGRHGQLFEGVIFYALWSKVLIYRKYSCNVSSFRSTVCGRAASFGFYEVGLNIFIEGTAAPDIQIKKKSSISNIFNINCMHTELHVTKYIPVYNHIQFVEKIEIKCVIGCTWYTVYAGVLKWKKAHLRKLVRSPESAI